MTLKINHKPYTAELKKIRRYTSILLVVILSVIVFLNYKWIISLLPTIYF
jgi:hypothetical protein